MCVCVCLLHDMSSVRPAPCASHLPHALHTDVAHAVHTDVAPGVDTVILCVCLHQYTLHVYTCMTILIHTLTHTCLCVRVYASTYMNTYMHTYTYTYIYSLGRSRSLPAHTFRTHANTHAHAHACTHTRVCLYAHTHVCAFACMHVCVQACLRACVFSFCSCVCKHIKMERDGCMYTAHVRCLI